MLLKAKYDKNLLEVALSHFNCTQEEWLALSRAISSVSVHDSRLDEIILKNALWGYHFDEGTQRVFIRRAEEAGQLDECMEDFIYFAIHEMIVSKAKPLNETISLLESYCGDGRELLACGLSHVYLNHGLSTRKSEEIINAAISFQEEKGILFPVFKGSKRVSNAYIEKYRPFVYKTLPGKDVRLYYKVDREEDWRASAMDYWRFGLYMARIPHFYNETITYYFSEELPTGSIATREEEVYNKGMYIEDSRSDPFFIINNATIYEQMFRYEQVEEIISGLVKDVKVVRSRLI